MGIAGGIGTDANCYRFMPHRLRGEGLFVAILRKPGEMRCERQKGKNKTKTPNPHRSSRLPNHG